MLIWVVLFAARYCVFNVNMKCYLLNLTTSSWYKTSICQVVLEVFSWSTWSATWRRLSWATPYTSSAEQVLRHILRGTRSYGVEALEIGTTECKDGELHDLEGLHYVIHSTLEVGVEVEVDAEVEEVEVVLFKYIAKGVYPILAWWVHSTLWVGIIYPLLAAWSYSIIAVGLKIGFRLIPSLQLQTQLVAQHELQLDVPMLYNELCLNSKLDFQEYVPCDIMSQDAWCCTQRVQDRNTCVCTHTPSAHVLRETHNRVVDAKYEVH